MTMWVVVRVTLGGTVGVTMGDTEGDSGGGWQCVALRMTMGDTGWL